MTREELLEIINKSRENNKTIDLGYMNLSHMNLEGIDLSGVYLSNVNFSHTNLLHANLSETNCYRANFYRACLYKTNFTKANLNGAILIRTDFSQTNLSETNLHNVIGDGRRIITLALEHTLVIYDDTLIIGCHRKRISEWVELEKNEESLNSFLEANNAVSFYKENKELIHSLIKIRQSSI